SRKCRCQRLAKRARAQNSWTTRALARRRQQDSEQGKRAYSRFRLPLACGPSRVVSEFHPDPVLMVKRGRDSFKLSLFYIAVGLRQCCPHIGGFLDARQVSLQDEIDADFDGRIREAALDLRPRRRHREEAHLVELVVDAPLYPTLVDQCLVG